MFEIFYELLTNILTSPLDFPINLLYQLVIFEVIGEIAYQIAFKAVGRTSIRGSAGSELHWFIRIIIYLILWAIVRLIIQTYYFLSTNWEFGFTLFGGIVGAIILPTIAISAMRTIKKLKVNHHA